MEVVPLAGVEQVAAVAADAVEGLVRARPRAVLGLATGSSPLPLYRELVRRHAAGTAPPYDEVTVFLLDEYVGLPPAHPQSYRATILREVTDELGIDRSRVHGPDPDPDRLSEAGRRYEEALERSAESTSRYSASAATVTSPSTSPGRRWRH